MSGIQTDCFRSVTLNLSLGSKTMLQQPYLPEWFAVTRVIRIHTNAAYLISLTRTMSLNVLSALKINCYSLKNAVHREQ